MTIVLPGMITRYSPSFIIDPTFPVAIKLLKPHYIPLTAELPDDTQPLLASTPVTPDASAPVESREPHFPSFDLGLARISLVFHILSYTFMAFAASPTSFTLLGVVSALGEGFSAAVQSVALELYTRRGSTESGRLFGALSVVQALWYVHCTPVADVSFSIRISIGSVPRS